MTVAPLTNRQRALEAKRCTRCAQVKPLDKFTADWRYVGGRKNTCKACAAEQQRESVIRRRQQEPAPVLAERQGPRQDVCPDGCGRWPTRPESGLCERHHQTRELQLGGAVRVPLAPDGRGA